MKNNQPQPSPDENEKPVEPLDDSWITRIDQGSATESDIDKLLLQLEQEKNDAWFASLIEQ
jgi:hypothetical protein